MRTSPGQTLLEAVVAIGIILTAVIGSSTLIVSSITAGRASQNRTEAANYAREGIEIIRSMRDSNWLKIEQNEYSIPLTVPPTLPTWNTGLSNGGYILTYTTGSGWGLVGCSGGLCTTGNTGIYLTVNSGRTMYNQYSSLVACSTAPGTSSCTATKYRRVITITQATDDLGNGSGPDDQTYLQVQSTVNWTARVSPTTLTSQIRLYDWK